MAITVKHSKVSTIPDDANTDLVRPSDWNADHTLVGTIDVANGGTGATTLTGYVKGNGTSAMTAVATVPSTDITGLGTMSTQNANAVAITGGTVNGTSVGATTASTGAFTTATASTSFASPIFKATSSAGGALQNSGGTNQLQWGGGGGNNLSVDVAININPANSQVDISPTGTGTVRINPATAGTINNTSIGATTPSTVNATTITGQTGVLRGTGQNLVLFSEQFDNGNWSKTNVTVSANVTTAPDGTSTADSLIETVANASHYVDSSLVAIISGAQYVFSVYAKKGDGATAPDVFQITYTAGFAGTAYANFAISGASAGTVTATGVTASITNVGNGWYRCSMVATANSSTNGELVVALVNNNPVAGRVASYTGSTTSNIFIWGAQFEIASTVGTYIPTTTTAVYGTPTLSFSGVSEIGLLSNGALYLQPAGTGALQAQATTSTATGGNARGANAVDFQMVRDTAARVASGSQAFIGAGRRNTASGEDSFVGGGFQNTASSSQAAVVNGARNNASGGTSFIGSGNDNTANLTYGTVVGGQSNTASGYFGFVGNGFTNSTTSSSSVTTQSATMNGTTAVTLSGSNANIKVGQLITGTYITFPTTYVAAISGTSLTLSTVASGSGTSTLSFFTPHGVVVGGGNNQATGSYSFIGGGGNAANAGQRNAASGDWSTVAGGFKNVASGMGSFIGGGGTDSFQGNTASGQDSSIVCGANNTASGLSATVVNGYGNVASGNFSSVLGGAFGSTRSIVGYTVAPASTNPIASSVGVQQSALLVLGVQTTDATPTALRSNTAAAGSTNQVILPNNSAYFFRGEVISGVTGGGDTKGWTIEGVIKRGANAASTALVGIPTVTSTYADLGAATWDIAVTADTTNGGIRVTFTGQLATTIRTVCRITTVEMTF
jgi:hypothetical protein